MDKIKTSKKRKKFVRDSFIRHETSSNFDLADKEFVKQSLVESLIQNDLETFQDVLVGYIRTSSKLSLSRKTKLGRTTLYDLIDPNKPFNPTLQTLGKIFEELAA